MAFSIDTIDHTSERDLSEAAALETAFLREVLGSDEPAFPPAAFVHEYLRPTRDDIDATGLLLRDDATGAAVGLALIDVRTGSGNEHMAWVPDLYVLPSHRRRGLGRMLLDEVLSVVRRAGRTLVLSGYAGNSDDGRAFAAAFGAGGSNVERQNRVRTADLDPALLESWLVSPAPGYSLVAWDDRIPDEHLDAFVRLQSTMNDAPRPDSVGQSLYSGEKIRRAEAERALDGRTQWLVVARHDETGELAGYTELMFGTHRPWLIEQGDTAVAAAHRGHGLGRQLKAANALRLLAEKPEATVIETWNDGSNEWMLAINDAMGFQCVAEWHDAELHLDAVPGADQA